MAGRIHQNAGRAFLRLGCRRIASEDQMMRAWVFAAGVHAACLLQTGSLQAAQADASPALSGQVTSAKEGPMEGVVVSAKREGSTITISVVSDAKGHFSFPASKIGPGKYKLAIRAIGYDLEAPATVAVPQNKSASAELKLRPVDDITTQMTPAEWIASVPGTED